MMLSTLIVHIMGFIAFQQGELPVPKKSKPGQKWGNFDLMDFLSANWVYLLGVAILIAIFLFYIKQKKIERKQEENARNN